MFERVLVATDFDDGLYRLARCRQSLESSGVKQLGFVHAIPWQDKQVGGMPQVRQNEIAAARHQIETHVAVESSALQVEILVREGQPSEVIRQAIADFQADVLVLGMPSRSLLAEKMRGSTTINTIQQLSIPVAILRPQLVASMTVEELRLRCRHLFDSLLVPCDLESDRPPLLDMLATVLCRQPKWEHVVLFYVLDTAIRRNVSADSSVLCSSAREKLEQLGQSLQAKIGHPVPLSCEVRIGAPVKEILAAAQEFDITAIATSSRNIGRIWELAVPSITGEILRRSWHTVLFFPPTYGQSSR